MSFLYDNTQARYHRTEMRYKQMGKELKYGRSQTFSQNLNFRPPPQTAKINCMHERKEKESAGI